MVPSKEDWELATETLLRKENKFHRMGQNGLLQWRVELGREMLLRKENKF
jgi:hypothetical protein